MIFIYVKFYSCACMFYMNDSFSSVLFFCGSAFNFYCYSMVLLEVIASNDVCTISCTSLFAGTLHQGFAVIWRSHYHHYLVMQHTEILTSIHHPIGKRF